MQSLSVLIKHLNVNSEQTVSPEELFLEKRNDIEDHLSRIERNSISGTTLIDRSIQIVKDIEKLIVSVHELNIEPTEDTELWFNETIILLTNFALKKRSMLDQEALKVLRKHIENYLDWSEQDISDREKVDPYQKLLTSVAFGIEAHIGEISPSIDLQREVCDLGDEILTGLIEKDIDPTFRSKLLELVPLAENLRLTSKPRADMLVTAGIRLPQSLRPHTSNQQSDQLEQNNDTHQPASIFWVTMPNKFVQIVRKIRDFEMFQVNENWLSIFSLKSEIKESTVRKLMGEIDSLLLPHNSWLNLVSYPDFMKSLKKKDREIHESIHRVCLILSFMKSERVIPSFSDIALRAIEIHLTDNKK